ncbi:TPA: ead/Ea22-like family protein [Klebsiella michiganensis]|nr:ead/Ea22-like family protein [Klebsiella michiganensis]
MTTDITELAQRLKAAAEKLGADQWQTRNGFSGTEVIVKGSLEKGTGCVSFQPVAADIVDTKTARAIALFSPANILALVEALEMAQQRNGELETYSKTAIEFREAARDENRHLKLELEIAEKRITELESRTVKMPEPFKLAKSSSGLTYYFADDVDTALAAAGIKWEAE